MKYTENDCPVLQVFANYDEDHPNKHTIELSFAKNGHYKVYIFMNEILLKPAPIDMKVGKGKSQLEVEKQVWEEIQTQRRNEYEQ